MRAGARARVSLTPLLVLGGVLAIACGAACRATIDGDSFWHLRVGHEILARHSTLPVDVFSYVARGRAWPYKDVVGDVILYAGYAQLGFTWFAILKGASVLALALALRMLARPAARPALFVTVLGLLVGAIGYRLAERPLLFSLALAPLLLVLLERARRDEGARTLLVAVGVVWIWAQLHREALVGMVLLFGYAQYLVAARVLGPRAPWLFAARPDGRRLAAAQAAWIVALALGMVNASGSALYRSTLSVFTGRALKESVLEWQRLAPALLVRLLPVSCALACAAGLMLAVGLARAYRRRAPGALDAWQLGCWIVFCERTLDSVRWLPYLCIVSAVIVLRAGDELLGDADAARPWWRRWIGAPVAIAALLLSLRANPAPFGVGEAPDRFPEAALAFAVRAGLHERVVNTLPFGGYVLWRAWPRFLVAIDGRNDMIYPPDYALACRDAERDAGAFSAMRDRDGADWVLADNAASSSSHRFLIEDPAWALVFHSDAAVIYVRRAAYPQLAARFFHFVPRLVRGDAFTRVFADARSAGEEQMLLAELEQIYAEVPEGVAAHIWLAQAYDTVGRPDRRDAVMRHLVQVRPGYATTGAR